MLPRYLQRPEGSNWGDFGADEMCIRDRYRSLNLRSKMWSVPLSLPPNFRRLPKRYIRFPSSKMETSRLRYRIRQSCGDSLKMGRLTCSPGISAMAAAPCSCNTLSAPVTS